MDLFKARNLIERLCSAAQIEPQKKIYTFYTDQDTENSLTYKILDQKARAIGGWFQKKRAFEERALLLIPPGLEYITAFFGCLYAGVIAVPCYPPRNNRNFSRISSILEDTKAKYFLTISSVQKYCNLEQLGLSNSLELLLIDQIDPTLATEWQPPRLIEDNLALLQYTSGSTGTPKGVMISHNNINANLKLMVQILDISNITGVVSWLPPFHDMGLVIGILLPLFCNCQAHLISPTSFIRAPIRWLSLISKTRASLSMAPNFAYELCSNQVTEKELKLLNLSCWKIAGNGAEPIRATTLENFINTFSTAKFNPNAIFPCYGLAEATLIVSGNKPLTPFVKKECDEKNLEKEIITPVIRGKKQKKTTTLISSGKISFGCQITIIKSNTLEKLPANKIGEILVSGESIAKGYWQKPELSEKTFRLKLYENGKEQCYLRTGDLGFIDENGNLFITGRAKDLIIIRGRNLYPQDIEYCTSRAHESLISDGTAAFCIEHANEEHLVIIQEVHRHFKDLNLLFPLIRKELFEEFEVAPYAIILIRHSTLPKTSSGKIQRSLTRKLFLDKKLCILAESIHDNTDVSNELSVFTPDISSYNNHRKEIERVLILQLSNLSKRQLGLEALGYSLIALGIDSLGAARFLENIQSSFHVKIPFSVLFEALSIQEIVRYIQERISIAYQDTTSLPLYKNTNNYYPLTPAQKRIWFLEQILPQKGVYNVPVALYLRGELNIASLEKAYKAIIERHTILNAHLEFSNFNIVQVIKKGLCTRIEYIDLSHLSSAQAIKATISKRASMAFDLLAGPLINFCVIRINSNEHILFVNMHQLITDGWSTSIFIKELSFFYNRSNKKKFAALDDLPIQYVDYAFFQNEWFKKNDLTSQKNYWKDRLANIPSISSFPTDRPRPIKMSYRGKLYCGSLSNLLMSKIKIKAQEKNVTLFVFLMAAFQALLSRYNGEEDIVIGFPIFNRRQKETENLIGLFANTLVLRTNFSANKTFAELLEQVRKGVFEAHENQDLPFEELVDLLKIDRELTHTPIFQILFVLQKPDNTHYSFENLEVFPFNIEWSVSKFDIVVNMQERANAFHIEFEYSSDLFNKNSIVRLFKHFRNFLLEATRCPEKRISKIQFLSRQEKIKLLSRFNNTKHYVPDKRCIHQLFEEQVESNPNQIAIVFDKFKLTYYELNTISNNLACHLLENGITSKAVVALSFGRSFELIIAILATLKIGAAYLPLDPHHPQERNKFILEDAQPDVLLLHSEFNNQFSFYTKKVIQIDQINLSTKSIENKNINTCFDSDHLAYIIYTSGSTGMPKGVLIEHKNIMHLFDKERNIYKFHNTDVHVLFHSYTFDLSVWEIWSALAYGGILTIPDNKTIQSPNVFLSFLFKNKVTVLNQTPAAYIQLSNHLSITNTKHTTFLRAIMVGGESWGNELLKRHLNLFPEVDLLNLYGPTECGVWSTYSLIYDSRLKKHFPITIGKAIIGTSLCVLDKHQNITPINVIGELYIAGHNVGRGYLNRCNLTKNHYIDNHRIEDNLLKKVYSRLYRTGDLVRYLSSGDIEYISRNDTQVKVRGYRVELGEIENIINQHEFVKGAIVNLYEISPNNKSLVAYLLTCSTLEESIQVRQIREFLEKKLIGYMVPQFFILLDQFPLNLNGKIDRKSLPNPALALRGGKIPEYLAPETELEKKLAKIWSEVLSIKEIGTNQNFFHLGGHSLLGTQLISRVQQFLGKPLPLTILFECPTIQSMADCLEKRYFVVTQLLTIIPHTSVNNHYPLSYPQKRVLQLNSIVPASAVNIQLTMRLIGALNIKFLIKAFNLLIKHHSILRTIFIKDDEDVKQYVIPNVAFKIKKINLCKFTCSEKTRKLTEYIKLDFNTAFDLFFETPIRGKIFFLNEHEHVLLINIHHIAADGWSIDILTREISQLYNNLSINEVTRRIEPPLRYCDYSAWQQNRSTVELYMQKLEYWKSQLKNYPIAVSFGQNLLSTKKSNYEGAIYRHILPLSTLLRVKDFSEKQNVTMFMTLLTLFKIMIFQCTNRKDILIGTLIANRNHQELENIMGYFVNALPLRSICSESMSFLDYLSIVKNITLEAYKNQDLPFELLLKEICNTSELNNPLFRMLFVLQNAGREKLNLNEITVEYSGIDHHTAMFDLSLIVQENPEVFLQLDFEYSTTIFVKETIINLALIFEDIIDKYLQCPELSIVDRKHSVHYLNILNSSNGLNEKVNEHYQVK